MCGAIFIDKEFFRWLCNEVVEGLNVDVDGIGSGGNNCFDANALTIHQNFQIIKHTFGKKNIDANELLLTLPTECRVVDPPPKEVVNGEEIELVQDGVLMVTE